jgi:manganese-dependent inorganic pyrophosphatase
LLCGILSDTLILKSTTTTDVDREAVEYLSAITNLDPQALGVEIIRAGSAVVGRGAAEIINQDLKEYAEGKITYSVSQIEVDNPRDVLSRKKEFLDILESMRAASKRAFAALLVTDITKLDSIMLLAVDQKHNSLFNYPVMEDNVYFLKGVVSRKKQLIPMLTELIASAAE